MPQRVIKKLPEFPQIMEKANQALTLIAEGKITPNSSYLLFI